MNKSYNLKVTNKQAYLIQKHIYDFCNYFVNRSYSEAQLKEFDEYDVFRIKIYKKEKRINKSYSIFNNLTEREIKFIQDEIQYWSFSGHESEPKEKQMAKRIINNINNTLSVQHQRNRLWKKILN